MKVAIEMPRARCPIPDTKIPQNRYSQATRAHLNFTMVPRARCTESNTRSRYPEADTQILPGIARSLEDVLHDGARARYPEADIKKQIPRTRYREADTKIPQGVLT